MNSFFIKGMDIGSSKITTIVGQYFPENNKLNIIGVHSNAAFGFKKGQITNLEEATSSLLKTKEAVERMTNLKLDSCHISTDLLGFSTISSTASIAITNQNQEVNEALTTHLISLSKNIDLPIGQEVLHAIPQKFSIDNQLDISNPIGMSGNQLSVVTTLVTCNSQQVKNLEKALSLAKINIQSLYYSPILESTSLTTTERKLGSLLIDIGGSQTTISFFQDDSLSFSKVLPVGSNHITNDLAIGLRITLEEAEEVKKIFGPNTPDEIELNGKKISTNTALNGIIKPRIEDIFSHILQIINDNNLKKHLTTGVVLTGGGSQTHNLTTIATRVLGLPVRMASINNIGGLIEEINSPAFVSTLGLISYHSQNPTSPMQQSSKYNGNLFVKLKSIFKKK